MPETTAPAPARTPIYKVKQSRFHAGESRIRWWKADIEEGTPYEKLFDPVFWDVHASKFAIGDFIDCTPDEGTYRAWLEVVSVGIGGVKVEEFFKKERKRATAPERLSSRYEVKYAGPHHKWRVMRIADKHIESSGHENESDANRWLHDNAKALTKSLPKAEPEAA